MQEIPARLREQTLEDKQIINGCTVTRKLITRQWAESMLKERLKNLLATEGAYFSGSESERPNIDFKKLDSYAQKHIELAKKVSYAWYGSVFDSRLMPGRYDWGGPKADALLSAYAEAAALLHRYNKSDAAFLRKFCADMTKMADAGDRDAMLVIVKAAKNWKFFFPHTKTPCPFKPGAYESKLKEMGKNDPLIPRLLAN